MNDVHTTLSYIHLFSGQVEDLLCEKIGQNWKEVSAAVIRKDTLCSGFITLKALRKVLEHYAIPLSDDHFQR